MTKTALIDLGDGEVTVIFNNTDGQSEALLTFPAGKDYSFSLGNSCQDAEEFILSFPLSLLNFRVVELPFIDLKKIRELLPFEMDNLILGGSGSIVLEACILSQSNGNSRVLVAYLTKDILKTLLERLRKSGIDPRVATSIELAYIMRLPLTETEKTDRIMGPQPLSRESRREAALLEMASPSFNFRQGEFAYTGDSERKNRSLRLSGILGLLVLLIFFADMGTTIVSLKKENLALSNEIRKTYLSLFPEEKKISNELYQLKAHIKELQDRKAAFTGISPLRLFLDLSKVSRPGISFSEVTFDRDMLVLKGECPSLGDVQKLKGDLEKSLSDVTISDTKPSSQGRTLFTITAKDRKS